MKNKKINFEYLNLVKEMAFFWFFLFSLKSRTSKTSKTVLVVIPCLIGEFAASLPALRVFIKNNNDKDIDIIVSPAVEDIAKKIIGIRNVFIASSVYGRNGENNKSTCQKLDDYEEVIVLRMSADAYNMLNRFGACIYKCNTLLFTKYVLHLGKNIILRSTPKQWRDFCFELFGIQPSHIIFEDIFQFTSKDYEQVKMISALANTKKKIIIHTGSNWPMKKWSNEKWISLIRKINSIDNFNYIFIGSNDDYADYDYIQSQLSDIKLQTIIGSTTLLESMLIMRKCDYFIGIDSGPANIAHLSDLRSVTILGPGPHMYLPSNTKDIIIDKSRGRGLYQMFFYKKNNFIGKINADEVFEAFQRLRQS